MARGCTRSTAAPNLTYISELGALALYPYEGNKDTLHRIHGTNQPE